MGCEPSNYTYVRYLHNPATNNFIWAPSLVMLLVGCLFVPLLGPHYDECLISVVARGHDAQLFRWQNIGDWTFRVMPYMGAMKAYLFAPLLRFFEPSIWLLRMPSLILAIVVVWLFSTVTHPACRARFSWLYATDPTVILLAVFDWGPTTLMTLLKTVFLWMFLKSSANARGPLLAVIAILGLYDKSNFVWFLLAMAFAVMVHQPWRRRMIVLVGHTSPWVILLTALTFTCMSVYLLWPSLDPTLLLQGGDVDVGRRFVVIGETFTGSALAHQLLDCQLPLLGMKGLILVAAMVAAVKRPVRDPHLLWGAVVLVLFLATERGKGPHHVFMAYPFPLLIAAHVWGKRMTLLCVAMNLSILTCFYGHMRQGDIRQTWDPALLEAIQYVREQDLPMVAGDWGIQTGMHLFLENDQIALPDDDLWRGQQLPESLRDQSFILISFVSGREAFPSLSSSLIKRLSNTHVIEREKVIYDLKSRPILVCRRVVASPNRILHGTVNIF
ncbi:MAG: hypothetical protein KDC35_13310 [Acidobacteria bacterium]|nr:hypothetical protein [Acidobacteriota bacterium]